MNKLKEYLMCFAIGGVGYGLVEILVRGYTHWSMVLTGGAVLVLLNLINKSRNVPLIYRCLLGMVVITSLEFAVGMLVNIRMGWGVWDYSHKPFNLLGQICLHFCGCWLLISIPAYKLCDIIAKSITKRQDIF
ncbi:MAG: hypothetical protein J6R20_02590 [Clostridia bacterium]|nr:hypothetical protein [Clostridia bacterium]